MAVFNNGRITAQVTPPQGYTGSYEYELFKFDNGNWVSVDRAQEGYSLGFQNPIVTTDDEVTFGNTDGVNDNVEGSNTWVGLKPGQYKVVVTTLTGLTCEVDGIATVGVDNVTNPDPEFTCLIANFQVANGTTDDPVSATVDAGTLVSVSPANYVDGSATYTATITIPPGYQNPGGQLTVCTDTATGTTASAAFDCGDTTITIANGTEGNAIPTSAVTATGVSNIIAVYETGTTTPASYINGTLQVDVVFEVPGGYSNTGDSFTCDGISATGTGSGGGGGTNNTIYYFHGFDDDAQEPWATESGGFGFVPFTDATADYYLANTIGGGQSDFDSTPVSLDAVMSHLIDNGTVGNYSILDLDAASGIIFAGQPSATVLDFPAITTGFNAQYYFAIPQSLTTTNYTNSGTCNLTNQSNGTSALPGQAADRKEFTYNGILYWLYRMSTPSQGQSYLGFNS